MAIFFGLYKHCQWFKEAAPEVDKDGLQVTEEVIYLVQNHFFFLRFTTDDKHTHKMFASLFYAEGWIMLYVLCAVTKQ